MCTYKILWTPQKKLLNLINEFGKTVGFKVNSQKSKAFSYTNNEISETEIRKFVILILKFYFFDYNAEIC